MENLCNWDKTTSIIQGDVTIQHNTSAANTSYVADFAMHRLSDGSLPYSAQGMCTYEHYAIMCWTNSDNTANRIAIMDLQTLTITDVKENWFTHGGHLNSMCVYGDKNGQDTYAIYVANGTTLYYFRVSTNGTFIGQPTLLTSNVSFGGICYNSEAGYLIGHSAGKFYRLETATALGVVTATLVFDGSAPIRTMYDWIYPGWESHSQSCEYHDGILYSVFSHPNTIFKYSVNGAFLGSESIPYAVDGHPCAELEDLSWSDTYNCFLINSQGRTYDDYFPGKYIWGRSYLFAWGGYASRNWRLEYSSNDGSPDNVQAGSLKQIRCVANNPGSAPSVGQFCRHTGIPSEPFNFITDAVYMSEYLESNSGRDEVHLYLSGDFDNYEQGTYNTLTETGSGITISGDLRVVIQTNLTDIPRINVANGATVDFITAAGVDVNTGIIRKINCSRNSKVMCNMRCPEVVVGIGATFCGNNLGEVKISAQSLSTVMLGNTNISIAEESEKLFGSLFIVNSAISGLGNLETSDGGDQITIVKAVTTP